MSDKSNKKRKVGRPAKFPPINKICEQCGVAYSVPRWSQRRRFCRRACFDKFRIVPMDIRFWSKVNKSGPIPAHNTGLGPCWEWSGLKLPSGYGLIGGPRGGSNRLTHRVAWEMTNGPIPIGFEVMHECDNTSCVRDSHLKLGTHSENMRDAWGRKRIPIGEKCTSSKLKESDVILMRKLRKSGSRICELKRQFKLAHSTVIKICNGERWKHIPV